MDWRHYIHATFDKNFGSSDKFGENITARFGAVLVPESPPHSPQNPLWDKNTAAGVACATGSWRISRLNITQPAPKLVARARHALRSIYVDRSQRSAKREREGGGATTQPIAASPVSVPCKKRMDGYGKEFPSHF